MQRNAVQATDAHTQRPAGARVRLVSVFADHDHFAHQRDAGQKSVIGEVGAAAVRESVGKRGFSLARRGHGHAVAAERQHWCEQEAVHAQQLIAEVERAPRAAGGELAIA